MGFSKSQSEIAIKNHGNVQVALENIFIPSKSDKCKSISLNHRFLNF